MDSEAAPEAVEAPTRRRRLANPRTKARASLLGDLGQRIAYVAVRVIVGLLRLLPLEASAAAAAAVTRLIGPWLRQQRRALDNLAIAFPERSLDERKAIARAMWGNMGRVFAETLNIDRLASDPSRIEIAEELHWRAELARPHPAIGVSAHIGNWELVIWPLVLFGRQPAGVYKPLENPYLDRYVRRQRERLYPGGLLGKGSETEAGSGQRTARLIIDHVRDGGSIGLVTDHFERRGVPVPFLGRHTLANPVPAMIARHVNARVYAARCLRIGDASRFRITITEIAQPPRTGDRARDTIRLTAAIFTEFEAWIREHPEQWMWWNTRWVPGPATADGAAVVSNTSA